MATRTSLAVDLGAESGRVFAIHFDGQRLTAEEAYRFPNSPVEVRGTLYWDVLRLWGDVQAGIRKVPNAASLGLDTWGVDFALVDNAGQLVSNPIHYRDHRADGMIDYVDTLIPRAEVFDKTGIQIMQINSLYQVASMVKNQSPALDHAARLLMVPDLLYYWLTGVQVNEFTDTTTSALYNPREKNWAFDVIDKLGIPRRLFGDIATPGQILGSYNGIPAVLAPHHDTASAVVAAPTQTKNFAYISSGTWSLLGLELPEPVINEDVQKANITNEGGYGGTFRFLKNIMGLWLIQEARRSWKAEGIEYTYDTLTAIARNAPPFVSLFDPDDSRFLAPGDMPTRIRQYCAETGQPIPDTVAAITRTIFDSLALKYRYVLRQLCRLTGQQVDVLHIVGGGSQNALLCQMTADATGCPVIAGPVEATSLGNAIVQLIALGDLKSVEEGRTLVRESFPVTVYEPHQPEIWDTVESRFVALVERKS